MTGVQTCALPISVGPPLWRYFEPDDEIAESFCELYGFDFYDKDIANHVHAQINKMWNAIKHQTTVEIC